MTATVRVSGGDVAVEETAPCRCWVALIRRVINVHPNDSGNRSVIGHFCLRHRH
ncbi:MULTISPECIES: hypothetical protein [unclassified Gordonia (in: high G+C Gram-positive bacteria)]|uniref:hypothetical protein n=1 Tax=unclassified Gordonia (in: high G+C Gram-positive bacteria) TaxID=2657482 RepID=UPI001F053FDB|nr:MULTISPECIES: hypothetical protein [unclassified Gordonia (in: high G+C Gram-positive bacteria)]